MRASRTLPSLKAHFTFLPSLFTLILLLDAVFEPICLLNSEQVNADTVLLVAGVIVAPFSIASTVISVCRKRLRVGIALSLYVCTVTLAWGINWITYGILVPPYIRFIVSYPGNVGDYHKVQFYFKHDGRWSEGPTVDGWPMTVSFPDLNHDGHRDIKVTENSSGKSVEFIYLPKNDGRCFWRPVKNDSRLSAAYPPANYYSGYP
jgi:hypothetical protein